MFHIINFKIFVLELNVLTELKVAGMGANITIKNNKSELWSVNAANIARDGVDKVREPLVCTSPPPPGLCPLSVAVSLVVEEARGPKTPS
jgi:hypothetical protein